LNLPEKIREGIGHFRTRKVDEDAKGLYGGYRHEAFIS